MHQARRWDCQGMRGQPICVPGYPLQNTKESPDLSTVFFGVVMVGPKVGLTYFVLFLNFHFYFTVHLGG